MRVLFLKKETSGENSFFLMAESGDAQLYVCTFFFNRKLIVLYIISMIPKENTLFNLIVYDQLG